jgi:hypothetical protein
MAEQLMAHTLEEGMQAIDAMPSHALRIAEVLATKFPAKSLADVAKEMGPQLDKATSATNPTCTALSEQVREEAAIAVGLFRAAEMWLRLKTPVVSDGNNFGVDVQNYVISELDAMRKAMEAFVTCGKDYHWARAEGVEKLKAGCKADSSTSESTETKDGKPEVKSTKSSSKTEAQTAGFNDYKQYLVNIDVKQYHTAYTSLTDIKNFYMRAHVLFAKNMKRLSDPRGEGEDGGRVHSMSMF